MTARSEAPPAARDAEPDLANGLGETWLLLVFQLPAKPAYLRVKIWRRLQALGAVAVKNAAYALPATAEAQEDWTWLAKEITQAGGEALICRARLIEGLTDSELRGLFDRARDADYEALAEEARQLAAELDETAKQGEPRADARARIARLRSRLDQVLTIDFFGAHGRQAAEGLLAALVARSARPDAGPETAGSIDDAAGSLKGLTWVTRAGVHVDRIASAWLVRRFIDAEARFRFVSGKAAKVGPMEVRFDMSEAEFTHEGDRCTFEVLLGRAGLASDLALAAVAEIVHDIDLKDGKFGRPEADGVRTLIDGLCADTTDDRERLRRGAGIFDDLHRSFAKPRRGR